MLHRHNDIASDLHASAQLARLAVRVGGLLSSQFLAISRILRLEKQSWSREYSSFRRGSINTCWPPRRPLSVVYGRQSLYRRREYPVTEGHNARSRWKDHGCPTYQHLRFFSHRTGGHGAPLPKSSPQRDSAPPTRLDHPILPPQKSVKGPSRASILRSTPASNVVLRGIESPDVERDKAEKESQMQAQQRKAKAKKEDQQRRQREAQEFASSQSKVARAEKGYQVKVVQPLRRWLDLLEKLSSELPPSLGVYRHSTTSNARAEWPLHRIQLLEKDIDLFSEELAELKRDLQDFETKVRALQKAVLTVAKQTMEDLVLTKDQGLHARSNALGNDYLRVVGEVILCLNDSSFLKIRQELIKREKWGPTDAGLPYPDFLWHRSRTLLTSGLQRRGTGIPFLKEFDNDFFRGSLDPRTLEALFGLYTARITLGELAEDTTRLLHVWRRHDKNLQLLNEAPYLSSYERACDRVDTLEGDHAASLHSTTLAIKLYGSMLFMSGDYSLVKHSTRFSRMDQLRSSLLNTQQLTEVLFRSTFCGGTSFLLLGPTSVLDRALIAMYRPFHLALALSVDVRLAALSCLRNGTNLQRPSLRGIIIATTDRVESVTREAALLLKRATFWSSAYDLYYGGNFRLHSAFPSQTNAMEELDQDALELPSVTPLVVTDDLSTKTIFYHERTAISVKYVSDVRDAWFSFQKLAASKLIALDVLVIEYVDRFNVKTFNLEYITLACESTVLIFHAKLASAVGKNLPILGRILEDPGIRKVGLNMSFVRQQFFQEFDWDIHGGVNIAGHSEAVVALDDPLGDPTQKLLAQLVTTHLGVKLPRTTDARLLLSDGVQDPLRFYRYLAARAHFPMQLYLATQAKQGGKSDRILPAHGSEPSAPGPKLPYVTMRLGPILVGPKIEALSKVDLGSQVNARKSSRSAYLRQMSNVLAGNVLHDTGTKATDTFVKHLQAYFLLTTFGESLQSVIEILRLESKSSQSTIRILLPDSIDHLYRGVLWVTTKFNLPLYDGHRDRLEAEVVSLGARRTAGKRKARGRVHPTLSSERIVAPVLTTAGRPSLPEIRPVSSETGRIQEDVSSSTRVVKNLPPEERRARRNKKNHEREKRKRQSDPDYRHSQSRKRKERRRRAKRQRARSMTGHDATASAVVPASSADGGSSLPEIEAAPNEPMRSGEHVWSSSRTEQKKPIVDVKERTGNARKSAVRLARQQERKLTDPTFKVKGVRESKAAFEERRQRRDTELEMAGSVTDNDVDSSTAAGTSSADDESSTPEIQAAPSEDGGIGGEISSSTHVDEQRSLEGEFGGTPKQRRRERARIRQREILHATPGYREAQQKRLEEGQKRRQAELERIAPVANSDAGSTTVVAASSSNAGLTSRPKDALT